MTTKRTAAALAALVLLALWGSVGWAGEPFSGKTIFWVDSYDAAYPWSAGLEKGIRETLRGSGVDLKVLRMDTKGLESEEALRESGERALAALLQAAPDVVIASDDNAQRYFVLPYLLGASLPVVFCGVNWDASVYGYPTDQVTGMVEVEGIPEMVKLFNSTARGRRIGYISGPTATDAKISKFFNDWCFDGSMKVYRARNFEEFKRLFLLAQEETDMLFLRNYAGVADWDAEEAKAFLKDNTRIPTGSHLEFMEDYVIYTMGKAPEEQGEYAARAALDILAGTPPSAIPQAANQRVKLTVNIGLAQSAGITVPISVLRTARVIGVEDAK